MGFWWDCDEISSDWSDVSDLPAKSTPKSIQNHQNHESHHEKSIFHICPRNVPGTPRWCGEDTGSQKWEHDHTQPQPSESFAPLLCRVLSTSNHHPKSSSKFCDFRAACGNCESAYSVSSLSFNHDILVGTRGSENPGSNPLRSRVATARTRSPSRGTPRNVPDDPGVEPPRLRLGRFEKITAGKSRIL